MRQYVYSQQCLDTQGMLGTKLASSHPMQMAPRQSRPDNAPLPRNRHKSFARVSWCRGSSSGSGRGQLWAPWS